MVVNTLSPNASADQLCLCMPLQKQEAVPTRTAASSRGTSPSTLPAPHHWSWASVDNPSVYRLERTRKWFTSEMSCGRFLLSKGFQLGFISILSHGPMIQRRSRISGFVNTFSSDRKPTTTNTVGNTNTCEKYNPFLQEARTWWGDCLHGGESAYWRKPSLEESTNRVGFCWEGRFLEEVETSNSQGPFC